MFYGGRWAYGPFPGVPVYEEDAAVEKEYLSRQTATLKKQLAAMEKRLAELETGGAQET